MVGAFIESNTLKKEMIWTINDLTYIQDIKASDQKIYSLAEQSHTNDVVIFLSLEKP